MDEKNIVAPWKKSNKLVGDLSMRIAIPLVYLVIVGCSYVFDLTVVFNLLTLPWSTTFMMLSGLILHMTVNGDLILATGKFAGAFVNVFVYLFVASRMVKRNDIIQEDKSK